MIIGSSIGYTSDTGQDTSKSFVVEDEDTHINSTIITIQEQHTLTETAHSQTPSNLRILTMTMRAIRQARAPKAPRTITAIVSKPRESPVPSSSSMGGSAKGMEHFPLILFRENLSTCAGASAGAVNAGRFFLLRGSRRRHCLRHIRRSTDVRRAEIGLTRFAQICTVKCR